MTTNGFHYRRLSRRDSFRRSLFKILAFLLFVCIVYIWFRLNILYFDYKPPILERNQYAPRIAIVSIVYDDKRPGEYKLAQNTMECYTKMYNYTYIKINLKDQPHLLERCPGKDFMFRRHCVIANLLKDSKNTIDWILFLDTDMAVVNPGHLIEEYIDEGADLIFYDRLFNYEITAGSYLAKNTEYTYNFLTKWYLYQYQMIPGTFQAKATDNAALHEVYLDEFCFNCTHSERQRCRKLWKAVKNWNDINLYESCARSLLTNKQIFENRNGRVIQRSDAVGYWARDGWITNSLWGPNDFIIHAWKESRRDYGKWATWSSPFLTENFNKSLCKSPKTALQCWSYNQVYLKSETEIRQRLEKILNDSYTKHLYRCKKINKLYPL